MIVYVVVADLVSRPFGHKFKTGKRMLSHDIRDSLRFFMILKLSQLNMSTTRLMSTVSMGGRIFQADLFGDVLTAVVLLNRKFYTMMVCYMQEWLCIKTNHIF